MWWQLISRDPHCIRKRETKPSTPFQATLLFAWEIAQVSKAPQWTNCSIHRTGMGMARRMALWPKKPTSSGWSKPGAPLLHFHLRLVRRIRRRSGRRIHPTGSQWSSGTLMRSRRRVAFIPIPFGTLGVCTTSTSRSCARKGSSLEYTSIDNPRSTPYPRLPLRPVAYCHRTHTTRATSSRVPPRPPLSRARPLP